MLRQILEYVGEDSTSQIQPREDLATHEVVLDVYVDGVCYTLTRSTCQPTHPRVALSPREKEIVHLVAKGLPTKAIADALNVSLWTVATHLRRTFAKLAHKGRAALEQIQLSLGHASVTTTERYLGVRQDLTDAPCDHLGLTGEVPG